MRLRHLALPAAAGLALFAIPFAPAAQAATADCSAEGNSCTAIIQTSGAPESFTVPAGVTQLLVAAYGGAGGSGFPQQQPADVARAGAGNAHAAVAARAANGATDGGKGGSLLAQVAVTPGESLTFVAGGQGSDAHQDATDAPGGYGGGGTSPTVSDGSDGAGGGGSFLFRGDTLLLAVGGGGGGGFVDGGDGGAGGAGAAGTDGGDATLGGKAATTSAPGAGGGGTDSSAGTGPATSPTAFGNGGVATQDPAFGGCSAGGGGGGYYGGGSGGCSRTDGVYADGGGGGGSGYVGSGVETLGTGTNTGDGGFVIGYTSAATTTTLSSDVTTLAPGQETTINAAVDGPELTIAGDDAAAAEAAVTKVAAAKGVGFAGAVKPAKANAAAAVLPPGTVINPGTACGATPCTVTFFVNGKQLADPISVDPATGVATIIFTAGSEEGVREITARYDGNLYYLQSTSDPLAITVSGLANTGPANVAPLLVTSTLLLLAGAGLVAFGRRRPQLGSHRAA